MPRMHCTKSEEEERDQFVPPTRIETEKYKVSRTLSFLRSRMVNTKIKNKVRSAHQNEIKSITKSSICGCLQVNADAGSALHQLCTPQQPVNTICEVCEHDANDKLQKCTCKCVFVYASLWTLFYISIFNRLTLMSFPAQTAS